MNRPDPNSPDFMLITLPLVDSLADAPKEGDALIWRTACDKSGHPLEFFDYSPVRDRMYCWSKSEIGEISMWWGIAPLNAQCVIPISVFARNEMEARVVYRSVESIDALRWEKIHDLEEDLLTVAEALNHLAGIEVPDCALDGDWAATTHFCNRQITVFAVRLAKAAMKRPRVAALLESRKGER